MTQVDFYVLTKLIKQDREILCCRIAEKAWKNGKRSMIQTDNEKKAKVLDKLLWTFRQESFIPHALLPKANLKITPITISWGTDSMGENEILINLAKEIPPFFSSFKHVIELVNNDNKVRTISRNHYRYYRDKGYNLNNYEI